ncbi:MULTISPECIES: NlpC/P60 family protein [Legionella]|uniref:NlpC/P60 family protein n=1 Tax=Legionella TaxID=445 RepID=UPI0009F94761|nr:MAG: hypothetical protein CK430_14760 [Legionella sp.]
MNFYLISELKRGDLILIRHNGKPYHVAIYAPNPEYIGDVIHIRWPGPTPSP